MKATFRWILLGGSLLLSGTSIFARPPGEEVRDRVRLALGKAPLVAPARRSADLGPSVVAPPQVTVHDVNPGGVVERDLCLTVAMGAGAAAECGDLRLVHVLPTMRTLSRARTPVLLYNSQHARPHALVAANVTLPQGTSGLQRVSATLWVDDRPRARGTWSAGWPDSGPARIALGFDAQGEATAVKRFVLEVSAVYSTSTGEVTETTRAAGALAIVNRRNSPFGPGWWLAGLEQLLLDPRGKPDVWVGGDGSLRRLAAVPGTTDRWVSPAVDRPDTLKRDGSGYVRRLPGGVQVRFDARGRHVASVNRLGHETSFGYTAEGRLGSISVPPAGSGLSYAFVYGADGRLARVDAPGADGAPRSVGLVRSGSQLTITDPDDTQVVFTHADGTGRRIVARKNRRGHTTFFRYDAGGKVAASRLDLENGDSIVTRLHAAESRGLAAAVHADSAYALLDGPREDADVLDHTRFWLDRFGTPRRIVDALGHETLLTRGDARFPALVTQVRAPNGLVTRATYDARGNVEATTVLNPYGDDRHATTRYEWEAKWDMVRKIVLPEGEVTTFAYDTLTGNRLWQQVGPDSARRVRFGYHTEGAGKGQLATVTAPGNTRPDSVAYDALGNVRLVVTPLGFRTEHLKDGLGRDTLLVSPIDTEQTRHQRQRFTYDGMDRIRETRSWGPEVKYPSGDPLAPDSTVVPAEALAVSNLYDREGNLERVSRFVIPDTTDIDTITTRWTYDRANRKVREIAADGRADSTVYDPASNPVRWITRRNHTIEAEYDALNRLVRRRVPEVTYGPWTQTISGVDWHFPLYRQDAEGGFSVENNGSYGLVLPADTAVYAYDAVGNVLRADNREAQVRRSYYPGGALRSDTLRIRTYVGSDFAQHAYGLRMEYDRNGRRTLLEHPESLAPRDTLALYNRARYAYHAQTGQLDTIFDVFGEAYRYVYDLQGRIERYTSPAGVAEQFFYDADGRLVRRLEGPATAPVHDDTLFYDARAKVLRARTHVDTVSNAYSGLGSLVWSHVGRRKEDVEYEEEFTSDALSNRRLIARRELGGTTLLKPAVVSELFYEKGTGRLLHTEGANSADEPPSDFSRISYDAAGNKERAMALRLVDWTGTLHNLEERAAFYYDAEQKLRVADRRTCIIDVDGCNRTKPPYYQDRPTFEEYRYDALGRRILVRTRSEWACGNHCLNALQRFVWDGSQILQEVSAPGATAATAAQMEKDTGLEVPYNNGFYPYGSVTYTLGQQIDRPLSVIRVEYSDALFEPRVVYPHENWNGRFDKGTFALQPAPRCEDVQVVDPFDVTKDTTETYCVEVDWPAAYLHASLEMRPQQMLGPQSWMGSLVWHQRDGTGQYYRRNRYYEPSTNRFTQEDPIGLAGGINLYGFANGDPVGYSDPYGLCPEPLRKADGSCPGGLSVAQWDKVESAAGNMSSGASTILLEKLYGGRIHVRALDQVSRVAQVDPVGWGEESVIEINTNRPPGQSLFDLPSSGDRAWFLGHEVGHVLQLEGRGGWSREKVWRESTKPGKDGARFRKKMERAADDYSCSNTTQGPRTAPIC